ncbi:MAG TPA: Gfo/Idh/MocA family oxidoreductase [Actinocrinis sp.]|uniref:Gfo/Idh/MocA family protein n=1 Tax=Actinocrinis sp. TaxID=1920516 RepID=UPI002DDD00D0|nr:Gfo/Idh/MocA family oxidoreductase [Actinocrinis sp.]HEV2348067.1 Gfo/Idh/MocA family oxidoreductase [Actinocrinis sp.]
MSETVRIGVLGCASIALRRTIPAILACPQTSLAAVASRDPEKAKQAAQRFGCDASTYEELLRRDDVDAVYVPVPPSLHLPWGLEVLRAGKHLLLEKPAATSADEARRLVDEAGARGLVLRENFNFLHHGQHRTVRELLAAGRLGTVRTLSAAFCFPGMPASDIRYVPQLGGGALLDAGVYPIRVAQLLFGADLRVTGSTLRIDPARGVDVAGQALLVSGDGVLIDAQFGFQHSYGSRYSVWGSTGRLTLDRAFTPPATWSPVLRIEEQDHVEERVLPTDNQIENTIRSFAQAVSEGRDARHPDEADYGAQTIRTAELVDEVRRLAVRVESS